MNERVENLWVETTKTCIPREGDYVSVSSKNIQEFAELLIKECISVARAADNGDEVYAWYAIQKHFGTIILL